MLELLNIILMTPQEGGKSGGLTTYLPIILIIVVFYMFFIRPQTKKAKDQKKFREALQKGDKVVTIGGIHGKILEIKETTAIIETEGQARLKIERSAISMDSVSGQEQIAQKK